MANLTFPSNPVNGQKFTSNGKVFEYNSTTQRWSVTRAQLLGSLPDDVTIETPDLTLDNTAISFSATGTTVYVHYTVSSDVSVSIANNGLANTDYAIATLSKSNNTITITSGTLDFSGANVVVTATNNRTSNTASISLSQALPIIWSALTETSMSLTAPASNFRSGDGNIIAIDGDTMAIGDPENDSLNTGSNTNAGLVRVYRYTSGSWSLEQTLDFTGSNNDPDQKFGCSVALSGDHLLVGASHYGNLSAGRMFYFTRSGTTWTEQNNWDASGYKFFGFACGFDIVEGSSSNRWDDTRMWVSNGVDTASGGRIWTYTRSGSTWTEEANFIGSSAIQFGYDAVSNGTTMVVGAPATNLSGVTQGGSAFIYTRSGSTWTFRKKIDPSTSSGYGAFGSKVAMSGTTIAIASASGTNASKIVDIYTGSGASWSLQQTISGDHDNSNDYAKAIWLIDDTLLISNPTEDEIDVWTRSGTTWTKGTSLTPSTTGNYFGWNFEIDWIEGRLVAQTAAGPVEFT